MGRIFVESKPTGLLGRDHTYLVYRDNNGNEFVTRGGPESDNPFNREGLHKYDLIGEKMVNALWL